MFMSGIAVESNNETFISIAFFLPFFPLAVPLPLPFPVVLVTYEHNIQLVQQTSLGVPSCSDFLNPALLLSAVQPNPQPVYC
jgi:hypothetical protein